jgi:sarcosine oxidase
VEADVDVAVVGAGLAGAATAWAASRQGLSVALLEQFEIGHAAGSSHGSARIFRRAYPDEFYVRLTGEAAELWRELEFEAGVELVHTTGGVDHGAKRSVEVIDAALTNAGVPHELLDPSEATRRWPGMRFETPVLFHPEAGVIDAAATVHACVELSRRRGATVLERSPVNAIDLSDDPVVLRTDQRCITARSVVVAAGPWISEVLPAIVAFPPVAVTQQQVFHFPRRDPSMHWPVFVHKDRLATYGLPGGRDGGPGNALKVAEHNSHRLTTARERDGKVDPAVRSRMLAYVQEWLPGLVPEPFNETTCLYTSTADEDFVLDRSGPIIVCSACSGHGAKFAPWVGTEAAKLAAGTGVVRDRFQLDRRSLVSR